ncbi:Crp/Fnr family transcriptional regulator [Kroppenstedtia guangzhouensis]|uniref:Crp/Fnr family transcriptional regulator n=1 Tax=Kroppenstedtia guangzhouensis TaxID=1274356 RepID=A0ABQ1GFY4_9BACL|nr:Crp/Fnr family transcriptional regulator [Kroppenstedtia guangzhouensis]GGA43076.1 Crp/Fnr family transcriptional regulator [Kroppenstedtia guangzhouensis]
MQLHRGEILFRQGEIGNLYRLESGLLKVVRIRPDGSSLLFNLLVPGEMFPHHSLISPQPYFATCIAVTDSQVKPIPAQSWYKNLEQDPAQYREVALSLQNTLRLVQQRMAFVTAPTRDRISLFREWLSRHFRGQPVEQLLTQEEIGQLVGLSRETVNRQLRKENQK